jgi:hypothetical protein
LCVALFLFVCVAFVLFIFPATSSVLWFPLLCPLGNSLALVCGFNKFLVFQKKKFSVLRTFAFFIWLEICA